MRYIQYQYTAIHHILTPLEIKTETIQLPHDLQQSLGTLFPQNIPLFRQKLPSLLVISFLPQAPFGPDPNMVSEVLFADFRKAVSEVRTYFDLTDIEIIHPKRTLGQTDSMWSKVFHKRHQKGIVLSVFDFYRLYAAAILKKQTHSVLLSLFLDPDHKFCAHVPTHIPLKDVFNAIPEIREHQQQYADSFPFQPILRRKLDPETAVTGHETALIMFSFAGYTVAPEESVLLRFPYFNRKVGIRKGLYMPPDPLPCVNCLACSAYCPVGLLPSFLYHHLCQGNTDEAMALRLKECIRCGLCHFVCPSSLPLYDTFVRAQQELQELT